jgi:hypothetical protein
VESEVVDTEGGGKKLEVETGRDEGGGGGGPLGEYFNGLTPSKASWRRGNDGKDCRAGGGGSCSSLDVLRESGGDNTPDPPGGSLGVYSGGGLNRNEVGLVEILCTPPRFDDSNSSILRFSESIYPIGGNALPPLISNLARLFGPENQYLGWRGGASTRVSMTNFQKMEPLYPHQTW